MADPTKFDTDISVWRRIAQISWWASTDKHRPILATVCLTPADGQLEVVVTDSYRLAYTRIPVEMAARDRLLIPAVTLRRWLAAVPAQCDRVTFQTAGTTFTVAAADEDGTVTRAMSGQLGDGEYPDYQSMLATAAEPSKGRLASFDARLWRHIERVADVAGKGRYGNTHFVRVELRGLKRPAVVTSSSDPEFVGLIMPVDEGGR